MLKNNNKYITIGIHIAVWLILFFIPYVFSIDVNTSLESLFFHSWLRIIFLGILFYLNYLYFYKLILSEKKIAPFLVFNLFFILLFILLKQKAMVFERPPAFIDNQNFQPMMRPQGFDFMFYVDFMMYILPVTVATAIRSAQRYTKLKMKHTISEKNQLESEIQYLKYQIQPHFFFNSLNNIYSLIDLDTDKAKKSVHSLSKLMRYLLYRTNDKVVSLKDEIDFLEQYIKLVQIRLSPSVIVFVDFPISPPEIQIAPLLLISLVENAFKHGVSAQESSFINFKIWVEKHRIYFLSENSNFSKSDTDKSGSGIGLENLKKRLQLLYPNKHTFKTTKTVESFKCELSIQVN